MRYLITLLLATSAISAIAQWQNMNGPFAGGALSFAGNDTYLYAANIGSIYRSIDAGLSWENAGSGLSRDVQFFGVQASGLDVLATGRRSWLYGAQNVAAFLSRDEGDTWTEVPLPFYDPVFYYGITLTPDRLFASDGNHIWEKDINGGDWALNALDADPDAWYRLVVQEDRLFALGYKQIAVCPDLNGQEWTTIPIPALTHVVTNVQALGDTIFVEDYDYHCYRTRDGGASWKRMRFDASDLFNVVHAGDAFYALWSYRYLRRSTDAGETWQAPAGNLPPLDGLAAANGLLFGNYYLGGSYRISDQGAVFTRIGKGMAGGEIDAFAQDEQQILIACGSNGLHRYDKLTETWSDESVFPKLYDIAATATDGQRIYAGVRYGDPDSLVFRSGNGGQTWLNITPETNFPSDLTGIDQLLVTPKALFIANTIPDNALWRSTDQGESWTRLPGSFGKVLVRDTSLFSTASGKLLRRSDDNGTSWQLLDTLGIDGQGKITDFFLAGQRIFANVKGPGAIDLLYLSEDDGKNWHAAQPVFNGGSYQLFSLNGNGDVVVGSSHRPTLSTDGGNTWLPFSGNLPGFPVSIMGADSAYIYAAVADRGLWRLPLAGLDVRTVLGEAYFDANLNNKRDPGETPAPGIIIAAQPAGVYAVTDEQGLYSMPLHLPGGDSQELTAHAPAPYNGVFPVKATVTNSALKADFAVQALPFGTDLGVYAALLTPIRQGKDFQILLTVRNEGGLPAGGRVHVNPDPKVDNYQPEPAPSSNPGEPLFWDIPVLAPGKTFTVRITGFIPAAAQYGLQYDFQAQLDLLPGELNTVNNSAFLSNRTYPIDRFVWKSNHREEIYWDEFQAGEQPVYTISFKNPFPDTVRHVRIVDYLEIDHDPATLQVLASSHPLRVSMQGDGYTEFFFDDIALPDTATNPEAVGFVVFRVGLRPGTPPETYVHNNASVYFDSNAQPYFGGTVQLHIAVRPTTRIVEPPLVSSPPALHIIPNPNAGTFRLSAPGFLPGESVVRIFNQSGRLCYRQLYDESENRLPLPPGLYLLQLTDGWKSASGKMLILR